MVETINAENFPELDYVVNEEAEFTSSYTGATYVFKGLSFGGTINFLRTDTAGYISKPRLARPISPRSVSWVTTC